MKYRIVLAKNDSNKDAYKAQVKKHWYNTWTDLGTYRGIIFNADYFATPEKAAEVAENYLGKIKFGEKVLYEKEV